MRLLKLGVRGQTHAATEVDAGHTGEPHDSPLGAGLKGSVRDRPN